jgi:transitional endoplasmic reticulum ATPase
MCDGKDVKRQLEDARDLEKVNPKKSRQYYLEAAETLLYLSTTDKNNEKKYVLLADKAYTKAQQIKQTTTQEKNIIQDKYMIASSLGFKDIGGLEELKEEITYKIIKPFLHPELYDYYGKKIGGGILMYGPPGCGKSMIAEATANEAGATFFNVKCSDLKSKYVGETEKNIAELFRSARENSPSIIFFDEFESVGNDRTGAAAYDKNTVAQLLTEMDGVGNKNQKILLLAATNEPWSIDPALLREGRFGTSLFIGLPDELAQKSILQLHLENKPLGQDVNIRSLLPLTKNLSGADITGLCEAAADVPLREFFRTKQKRSIIMTDFAHASTKINSVMQQWFTKALKQVTQKNLITQFPELVKAGKKVVAA